MEETVSPKRPNRPKKYEKIPPSPYAPLFIEKLLLAIIEKNEVPAKIYDVSETVHLPSIRLNLAMKALFGVSGRTESTLDLPELVSAINNNLGDASQRQYEIEMLGIDPRKTSVSFSKVLGKQGQTQTADAGRTDYARLSRKSKKKSYAEYLYWIANVEIHDEETDMQADLLTITSILERWLVKTDIASEKVGLFSLTRD